ncbi:hypothetical protein CDAR_22231 [Caerostris darwini]|uniref:Uncharacterized protein n=1 Tax=Caerostris darwini TaxID=1538125 RepID=A0AAV4UST5_9ARAC|nr:hypothetical protein CDAR_22231 [Caerostris darwini]
MPVMERRWLWREIGGGGSLSLCFYAPYQFGGLLFPRKSVFQEGEDEVKVLREISLWTVMDRPAPQSGCWPPASLVAANDPRPSSTLAGERECCGGIQSARMAVVERRWLWREIGGGGSLSLCFYAPYQFGGLLFIKKRAGQSSMKNIYG